MELSEPATYFFSTLLASLAFTGTELRILRVMEPICITALAAPGGMLGTLRHLRKLTMALYMDDRRRPRRE